MKMKAQGAVEYLFMIAAALVVVLIVFRKLQSNINTASTQAEALQNETIEELNETISNSSG